jgi:hypothetical protein
VDIFTYCLSGTWYGWDFCQRPGRRYEEQIASPGVLAALELRKDASCYSFRF